ncbi:MAG: hypothetical protein KF830_06910 [Planctomycetes bacterium]|nr:hypothetical protein [Planctomycetota bacterium]
MRRKLGAIALLPCLTLAACGTTNGVRWAYGHSSVFDRPDAFSESMAARAVFGVPVIVVGVAFDACTWPFQLLFGVWPMWGGASTQMDPNAT